MIDLKKQKAKDENQVVIFKLADEEFAVDICQVKEIVKIIPATVIPRSPDFIEGVINLRGQILVVIDLAKRLKLIPKPHNDKTRIIVVEVEDNIVGMIVDEVSEVLRISQDKIVRTPQIIDSDVNQKYITGVAKFDSRLLILIDLLAIFSAEEMDHLRKVEEEVKSVKGDKPTPPAK